MQKYLDMDQAPPFPLPGFHYFIRRLEGEDGLTANTFGAFLESSTKMSHLLSNVWSLIPIVINMGAAVKTPRQWKSQFKNPSKQNYKSHTTQHSKEY